MSVAYQYDHFEREVLFGGLRFKTGPAPGEAFPDFDLETTDGEWVRRSDFVGKKPVLMTFGSVT
jgi:hypothetical protein